MLTVWLCAAAGGWAGAATAGPPLETLFFSSTERQAIVHERHGEESTLAPSHLLKLTGVVKRVDGRSTAFVNGQALTEGQSDGPARLSHITAHGATLNGKPLSVGETLDTDSGARTDLVAPGAVQSGQTR